MSPNRTNRGRYALYLTAMVCCAVLRARGQDTLPSIKFTLDFPGSDPAHYVIEVFSDGRGIYESDGAMLADSGAGDQARSEFLVSRTTENRIFDLAKRAHYFEGKLNSKGKGIAYTGTKTLRYKDAQKTTEASYNYSPVPAIQDLTALLQNLSTTLEFGRRLEYELQHQKLALDEELKKMEDAANQGQLGDVMAISPTLKKITTDQSLLNVVRARAQRLSANAGL